MARTDAAPFHAGPDELRALSLSLNHPVMSLAPLPCGPAAAAIAVHETGAVMLVIRSQRSGAVAYVDSEVRDAEQGFERALASAESLGFLFERGSLEEGAGLDTATWPRWLREIFAEPGPKGSAPRLDDLQDASGWLSKFRWALPQRG